MSSRKPLLVTIGISTYNRANGYLKDALRSAINQTYPHIEIIVSDNCSTDSTEAVVKSFGDPRIQYFKQAKNIGANSNFNFCLEKSHGDYFLLLHDDDLIDTDFVEVCIDALGNACPGIIRTGTRIIDENGKARGKTPNIVSGYSTKDLFSAWFLRRTAFYFCSTLFNAQYLKQLGGFKSKTNLFQDVVALVQLAAFYGRVDVSDVKASFRRHGNNAGTSSSSTTYKWSEDSLYLLDLMCSLVPEQADIIKKQGLPYLCRKCYRYIPSIPSSVERWKAYLQIYKQFEYSYSPIRYLCVQQVQSAKRLGKRIVGAF